MCVCVCVWSRGISLPFVGRRYHLALLFDKHTKAPETRGVGPRIRGRRLGSGSSEPEEAHWPRVGQGQHSLLSFVEMALHTFTLKCFSEEGPRWSSLIARFGGDKRNVQTETLQERFTIPFVPPSWPCSPALFIPSCLSQLHLLSVELRKSENRPEPGHDRYFPARELHHYNFPHSSPPGKRTSQSRGWLMPGPPELCLAAVHGRCPLVRPGKNVCVGWERSSTRLKSGSPGIY